MDRIRYTKRTSLNLEETDFLYTEIILDSNSKKIFQFVVLQTYEPNEISIQIKKHDCAHGRYHIHHYYLGVHSKTEETTEPVTNELFYLAKRDIRENWLSYRKRFQGKTLIHDH
jgi:hypothetical protein